MQSSRCHHVDEPSTSWVRPATTDIRHNTESPLLTTSDYYSESHNKKDLSAPVDITNTSSPLLDFGKKEKEYISKVIQITCQRTTLLRKTKHGSSSHFLQRRSNTPSKGWLFIEKLSCLFIFVKQIIIKIKQCKRGMLRTTEQ